MSAPVIELHGHVPTGVEGNGHAHAKRTPLIATVDVLDALFPTSLAGHLELRMLPSKMQGFLPLDEDLAAIKATIQAHQHENIYFGVAVRGTAGDGSAKNCTWLSASVSSGVVRGPRSRRSPCRRRS